MQLLTPLEPELTHASMLKARRTKQKRQKLATAAVKKDERLAKQALKGPVPEKVKKVRVKKEKVQTEKVAKPKAPKVDTKQESGKQPAKKPAGGKKGS